MYAGAGGSYGLFFLVFFSWVLGTSVVFFRFSFFCFFLGFSLLCGDVYLVIANS